MSTAEWKPAKLDGLGFVGRGKSRHRPRNAPFLYGGPYPFFQTGDIKAANFYLTEYTQTYSEEGLAQSKLWRPGTLCITIAANIAENAILGVEGCFPDSVVGFIADSSKADVRFIKYCMDTLKLRMQSVSQGAAQDNLSVEKLLSFDFRVPPLSVQRHIARILSTYDELMENCHRRIQVLETMAYTLYREWFVYFRFPDHDNVPNATSLLGDIPWGWEVKKIGAKFKTVLGGTPSREKSEFWEHGTIPWINSGKVNDLRITAPSQFITELALERSAAKLMPKGTTVLAITGATLGQVSYLEIETAANQSVVGIVDPSEVYSEWIYLTVSDRIQSIINHASGGAQQHINKEVVNDVLVALPPIPIAKAFKKLVGPMFREVATLLFQTENLRRTRDLLLPRLLSGQVSFDVSADTDVAEPTAPAPPLSQMDLPSEEPMLRAAEEAPPYRVARDDHGLPPPAESTEEPVPIDQIDRTAVLQAIRQVFSEGPPRERDAAIRDVARALGYRRAGPRIQEILRTDLLTAVRRCILENQNDALRLCARSITDYDRDFLKKQFLAAIGRTWIDRDTAIRDFCRWLGFARTGPIIEYTARSLINGLIREARLETDRADLIRRALTYYT